MKIKICKTCSAEDFLHEEELITKMSSPCFCCTNTDFEIITYEKWNGLINPNEKYYEEENRSAIQVK